MTSSNLFRVSFILSINLSISSLLKVPSPLLSFLSLLLLFFFSPSFSSLLLSLSLLLFGLFSELLSDSLLSSDSSSLLSSLFIGSGFRRGSAGEDLSSDFFIPFLLNKTLANLFKASK